MVIIKTNVAAPFIIFYLNISEKSTIFAKYNHLHIYYFQNL